ncbi:SDR family oxidoreductase [Bacillus sp. P14.5]|uniref:SDR family oxidoreductase n=1 Tax=Bacillus sp. P14.5 TaxID=1983400 RepID=UPI000DE9F6A8|nr:SDR family oxidoreductase [Bacillus sp. P14.5]
MKVVNPMRSQHQFKHKNILITGAAGGLGRELCITMGNRGATILAIDINRGHLDSLKTLLNEQNITCHIFICDITDKNQCQRTIGEISKSGLGIDMVIHNAGISHRSPFIETKLDVLENVIKVNVNGTINLTHYTLKQIIQRQGTYVVVSSVAGFAPVFGRTGYAASKHALHGFFETLRAEVEEEGVNVLMVCPSFMKTAMEHTAMGGDGKHVSNKKQTVGNVLTPEIVAEQIVKGISANKKRIYISPIAKLSMVVSRFTPLLYGRIMRKKMSQEFRGNSK